MTPTVLVVPVAIVAVGGVGLAAPPFKLYVTEVAPPLTVSVTLHVVPLGMLVCGFVPPVSVPPELKVRVWSNVLFEQSTTTVKVVPTGGVPLTVLFTCNVPIDGTT